MIDISPKALRFARLAAEHQPAFAGDMDVEIIKQEERSFEQKSPSDRVGQYVNISDRTAAFCLRAVNGLLQDPSNFQTSVWDGNDLAFLQAVARDLDQRLAELGEKVS